ncbi:4'-phosphopantetheinyl transferase superfamily protein [Flammeovirga sp. MY04]|uniref:4'-phosphopantetheinyl transferase family protein n=1 Tax=Flammeovirga sp. MY04 TaxID=1191459 RepID=UPI00080616A2|nr:4'-phosphopantetheinyl transferase superfamily protein [Flammeovirga sp. MY04]ANQ47426.1 4'-phosphopantetheinyl transferase superfamily protein [Flammeovirga sp. MY04]
MINLTFTNSTNSDTFCCPFTFHKLFDIDKEEANRWLHPKEVSFFNALVERRKQTFLSGRKAIKQLLFSIVPIKAHQIEIGKGIFEQPFIKHQSFQGWECSIAHSQSHVASILFPSDLIIGIDVESNQEEMSAKTKGQITYQEKMLCLAQGVIDVELKLWSAKEALSKCLKTGLTIPFTILEINSIVEMENQVEITFKNFPQYKVSQCIIEGECLSVCYPIQLSLDKKIAPCLHDAILI